MSSPRVPATPTVPGGGATGRVDAARAGDALAWLIPDWPAPPGVRALSTRRTGGLSRGPYASLNLAGHVGDAPSAVAGNRRLLRDAAGLPADPCWLEQVHGARVADLDAPGAATPSVDVAELDERVAAAPAAAAPRALAPEPGRTADAAITRRAGRVCAILTADCLPVLLASTRRPAIAAVHAGWRGLAAGVVENAVAALGEPPSALVAWLGPAIGPAHFEVGAEVRDALMAGDPGAGDAFRTNDRGRFMADLEALARRQLTRLGVGGIFGRGECTYAGRDHYFSHRRDGTCGRQATLIWLEA